MAKSQFICARCEHPVHGWAGGWKHCLGGRSSTRSCGRAPEVIARTVHEQRTAAALDAALGAIRDRAEGRVERARGAGLEPATSGSKARRSTD